MRSFLLILLLLASIAGRAQKSEVLNFYVQFKPELKYTQTIIQKRKTEVKYSGSKEALSELKSNGVQNPTIQESDSELESIITTGTATKKGSFPITIEIVESSGDESTDLLSGALIYGSTQNGNIASLDSVVIEGLDNSYQEEMLKMMEKLFAQVNFPEKQLKIGESTTYKTPISLPIGKFKLDMEITNTYTLVSINNGIAEMKISQVYTMKSKIDGYKINATGNGTGTLTYDIESSYPLVYKLETGMGMKMNLDSIEMDLNITADYIQTTVISSN